MQHPVKIYFKSSKKIYSNLLARLTILVDHGLWHKHHHRDILNQNMKTCKVDNNTNINVNSCILHQSTQFSINPKILIERQMNISMHGYKKYYLYQILKFCNTRPSIWNSDFLWQLSFWAYSKWFSHNFSAMGISSFLVFQQLKWMKI